MERLPLLYKDRRQEGDSPTRQTQLVQLHLLAVLAKICEDHDIDYWLTSGTLLGALRHGGPIPWDDDLDVWMLEDDFERFKEAARDEMPDDVFLTDPDRYQREDSKLHHLIDAYSIALKRSKKRTLVNDHLGINIDLFLMRRVGGRNKAMQLLLHVYESFIWRSRHAAFGPVTVCGLLCKWLLLIGRFVSWLTWSIAQACCLKKKWLCPFYYNGAWKDADWHSLEEFNGPDLKTKRYIDYDGERFQIPVEAEKVLVQHFGDWKKLPPEDKRVGYFDVKLPITKCFHYRAIPFDERC